MALKRVLVSMLGSVVVLVCLFSFLAVNSSATSNTNYTEEEYVRALILSEQGIEVIPTNSYLLMDTSGEKTFCCVEFSHSDDKPGYAVIDLTDYKVIMYSMSKLPPFNSTDTVICGGTLNFAVVEEETSVATIIGDDKQVAMEELLSTERDNLSVLSVDNRMAITEEISKNLIGGHTSRNKADPALGCDNDDEEDVFDAGGNSGEYDTDCGINAAAMYLNYLDRYYGGGYLPKNVVGELKIKKAISAYATRTLKENLLGLTGSELATICNGYTKEHGTVATNIASSKYTFTKLKNTINNGKGKPCILRLPEEATEYWVGSHFVIGLGYTNGATSSKGSIHVNSGWKSYGFVYIPTSAPSHIVK